MLSCFSTGWSVCRIDMPSSDVAAWLQAIGSLVGIAIAILVPYTIHKREQFAADAPSRAYRSLIRDALLEVANPLAAMSVIGPQPTDEGDATGRATRHTDEERQHALETAQDIAHLLSAMKEAVAAIGQIETVSQINTYDLIRANFKFKMLIDRHNALFEREIRILNSTKSSKVVLVAIDKLREPTREIYDSVQDVIAALDASEKK